MSMSTWAAARETTDAAADVRPTPSVPAAGAAVAVRSGHRRIGARERFPATRRPALRLVPPLPGAAAWPDETTVPSHPAGGPCSVRVEEPIGVSLPAMDARDPDITAANRGTAIRHRRSLVAHQPTPTRSAEFQRRIVAAAPSAGAHAGRAPIRLTRRGGMVLAGLLTILVAALVLVLASTVQAAAPPGPPSAVVVHEGDTLWSIAARVHPRGSLTNTMLAIERLNHMTDGTVYVGQQLLVPPS
jgi:LysM repeat protein